MFAAAEDVNVVGDVDTAGVYCDRFYDNFDNHADMTTTCMMMMTTMVMIGASPDQNA